MAVTVELLSAKNWRQCLALELAPEQRDFFPPIHESLIEGQFFTRSEKRVILEDGRAIGFAIYGVQEGTGRSQVFRLLIDRREQGKGFGRAAMQLVLNELFSRAECAEVFLCYHPENEGARRLSASLGFRERGLLPNPRIGGLKAEAVLLRSEFRKT